MFDVFFVIVAYQKLYIQFFKTTNLNCDSYFMNLWIIIHLWSSDLSYILIVSAIVNCQFMNVNLWILFIQIRQDTAIFYYFSLCFHGINMMQGKGIEFLRFCPVYKPSPPPGHQPLSKLIIFLGIKANFINK